MFYRLKIFLILVACSLSLSSCTWLKDWWSGKKELDEVRQLKGFEAEEIQYKVKFEGDFDESTLKLLEKNSLLILLAKHPPISKMALIKRIKADKYRLRMAMASKGFYDATIKAVLVRKGNQRTITFTIIANQRYKISRITIKSHHQIDDVPEIMVTEHSMTLQLAAGDFVKASSLFKAQVRLESYLHKHGYPFAKVHTPEGIINYTEKTAHIIFRVKMGPPVFMGKVHVTGLKSLKESFVENNVAWEEGESFDERKVEAMRSSLIDSSIFSGAVIKPAEEGNGLDPVVMNINVSEGPPRAVGFGAQYATSQGAGAKAFWRHYNLLGGGEFFQTLAQLSKDLSQFIVELTKRDVFMPKTNLKMEAGVIAQDNRAYQSKAITLGAYLERPLTLKTRGSIGLVYELARFRRNQEKNNASLFGTPIEINIDESDNLLNPTEGYRLDLLVAPYYGKMGERLVGTANELLLRTQATGSFYWPLKRSPITDEAEIVIASWGRLGYALARELEIIPFDKRFYSGGTGSVRAYGYQRLGPLDAQRKPIGGCSLAEGGIELRTRVTKKIELVAFIEGGSITRKGTFNFKSKDFLWGGGFGGRYFSIIGPARLDIAFPFKRRKISGKFADSMFQIMVSIGQAF